MIYDNRYVEIALGLIESAGEFISEHVWFRVVQIITNNPEMQVLFLL